MRVAIEGIGKPLELRECFEGFRLERWQPMEEVAVAGAAMQCSKAALDIG